MRTRAAVCADVGGPLEIVDVDLRPPGRGEVLVRIAATGVCASDLHVIDGSLPKPMPIVPGHEAAGVVEQVGPGVERPAVGDHVALTILPSCGRCGPCLSGRSRWCAWGARLATTGRLDDGTTALRHRGAPVHHFNGVSSWAAHAVVPAAGAVPITRRLPLWQAALLGCAVATGFGAVRNAAQVRPGESVAVIGCGGVGLNVVQAARQAGADPLVAVDTNPDALALARRLGATRAVSAASRSADAAVRTVLADGATHVFEVLGRPETVAAAWRATAPGGTTVVVGLLASGSTVQLDGFDLITEKRLVGTYMGGTEPHDDLPALAAAAVAGDVTLAPLVTQLTLDDLPVAVERLRAGQVTARQVVRP